MKGDMMIFAPVFLLLCWMLPADTRDPAETGLEEFTELDMAPDSVDDMYDGCKDKMKSKVLEDFMQNEEFLNYKELMKNKKDKDNIWSKVLNIFLKKKKLGEEQTMATYVYTRNEVYSDFNKAVQTQKSQYQTTFKYHTLHFFLTEALQILKPKTCRTVYRATRRQLIPHQQFRFGSFASSSMEHYLKGFGDKSCFEIVTCHGADISEYSEYKHEKEVLIPPYEVFKVTEKKERSKQKDLPCEVVWKVESTKELLSNTNCAFFPKSS